MAVRASSMGPRVYVVTGASSGIGLSAAESLLRAGGSVVALGRDEGRLRVAAERLQRIGAPDRVAFVRADLTRPSELQRAAAEILTARPRIDVLLHNAGALFARAELTPEGFERTWALNVLAPFLLTQLLLDRLRASSPSRVVMVASAAHRGARLRFGTGALSPLGSGYGAYARSKLALLLLTRELARRLEASNVTVNAAHPGFVATRFGWENPGWVGPGFRFLESLVGISPAAGARTLLYLADAPELEHVSGRYFARERERPGSRASRDPAVAARLYSLLESQAKGLGVIPTV